MTAALLIGVIAGRATHPGADGVAVQEQAPRAVDREVAVAEQPKAQAKEPELTPKGKVLMAVAKLLERTVREKEFEPQMPVELWITESIHKTIDIDDLNASEALRENQSRNAGPEEEPPWLSEIRRISQNGSWGITQSTINVSVGEIRIP